MMQREGIPALREELKHQREFLQNIDSELEALLEEIDEQPDRTQTRAIASILHDFYNGVEKIFERIARQIDRSIPEGDDGHNQLLRRMTMDIDGVRNAVITTEMENQLYEYLRFRHLFRHMYGFQLDWK